MAHDVFISYSSKDQKVVEALSHYLEERGIRCFIAYRDIPKGKVWASVITETIENCQMMVVVFSKEFNISEHVDREIELCAEEKKPILTFRIQDEAFKGAKKYYLKNLNWIDAFPNPNECFQSLFISIDKLLNIENLQENDEESIGNLHTKKKIDLNMIIEPPKIIIQEKTKVMEKECKGVANFTETVNGVSFDMVAVEGGSFEMGDVKNGPIHRVMISSFFMSRNLVSQKLWMAVMGYNPSFFKGDNNPVECISWFDAVAFCNNLSNRKKMEQTYEIKNTNVNLIPQALGYRLPTEAEWEYAAGGGAYNRTIYAGTNLIGALEQYAWFKKNSSSQLHQVERLNPNMLGLHDMSGNVWEWCYDRMGKYGKSEEVDPIGPLFGAHRVRRGGAWNLDAMECLVANRYYEKPEAQNARIGFRLVFPSFIIEK